MLAGIDVSAHQATTPSLLGRSFLIARAAYGAARDGSFGLHIAAAKRARLVTGAYLFGRHGNVGAQVVALLAAIADVGDVDLVALDLEADGDNPPMSWDEARDAIARIQATGRPVGLYHSTSGYPPDALGADWRWVADYRPLVRPPIAWDVWQKRGSPLDLDVFDGTIDQLRTLGGRQMGAYVAPFRSPIPFALDAPSRTFAASSPYGELEPVSGTVQVDATVVIDQTATPHGAFARIVTGATGRRLVAIAAGTFTPPVVDCTDVVDAALEAAATRAAAAVRNA